MPATPVIERPAAGCRVIGGNDTLTGGDTSKGNYLYGDAFNIYFGTQGGDDVLTGGAGSYNEIFGESYNMNGGTGGDDTIVGGDDPLRGESNGIINHLYGEAREMSGATGGDDTITAHDGGPNFVYGDAFHIVSSTGGNDILTGGDDANSLYGDAYYMDQSTGGNDTLTGKYASFTVLYGDAVVMEDGSIGGDDILSGGSGIIPGVGHGYVLLVGDATFMFSSIGGDDTLISGTTTDDMYGDGGSMTNDSIGGADTFVFLPNNYRDTVFDFRSSDGDKIDLTALNIGSFGALEAHLSIQDGSEYDVAFNTLIDLGAAAGGAAGVDTLTVVGISNLQATDFQLLG